MQAVKSPSKRLTKYASTQHVDTVIRNYKQERWAQNSDRLGKEDSLSAWWSIEEMENFIAAAKEHGADGLKFYFGAYGSDYKEVPEYAGRQTLVMVGTRESATTRGLKNKDLYIRTESGTNILANNSAAMCPPKCGPMTPDGLDMDNIGVCIVDRGEKGFVMI